MKGIMKIMRRGATLIEVLIAIAVTTILSSVLIIYGGASRAQLNLYVETVKFAQVVLRAKSMSIALYSGSSSEPACGYGIRIASSSYDLFRYQVASVAECNNITPANQADYVVVQHYSLNSAFKFDPAPGITEGAPLSEILFVPPEPTTYLWGGDGNSIHPSGIAVLTDGNNSNRTITVTTAGQISY